MGSVEGVFISQMQYLRVIECNIHKCVDMFGCATIKGYIKEDKQKEAELIGSSTSWISILQVTEEESGIVFSGEIKTFDLTYENGFHAVKITLVGCLKKMDFVKHTRIFQNAGKSFGDIISAADSSYGAVHILKDDLNSSVGKLIMQYKETDWEFIKRVSSMKHLCLIPYYQKSGCYYYAGLASTGGKKIKADKYSICTDMEEYRNKKKNGVSQLTEADALYYEVKSKAILQIGERVSFNGKTLYVYRDESKIEGSELIHTYELKTANAFLVPEIKNYDLIGCAFIGTVKAIQNDLVKVLVQLDGHQEFGDAKWFPFSTVYSSSGNAGWYCMPEVDDEVRVVFPTENADDAYVVSAVHTHMGSQSPDVKFLRNPTKKEIRFEKNKLTITNNDGLTIELNDETGIRIQSNKNIELNADKVIKIESKNSEIDMEAANSILLNRGKSQLMIGDDVDISAEQVHVQNIQ